MAIAERNVLVGRLERGWIREGLLEDCEWGFLRHDGMDASTMGWRSKDDEGRASSEVFEEGVDRERI